MRGREDDCPPSEEVRREQVLRDVLRRVRVELGKDVVQEKGLRASDRGRQRVRVCVPKRESSRKTHLSGRVDGPAEPETRALSAAQLGASTADLRARGRMVSRR